MYSINSPSIHGILSDDFLYFEGIHRPGSIFTIRDGESAVDSKRIDILEKYFNDIYNLFLRKLSAFAMFENMHDEEAVKIQALLQELIKVKNIICNFPSDRALDKEMD